MGKEKGGRSDGREIVQINDGVGGQNVKSKKIQGET